MLVAEVLFQKLIGINSNCLSQMPIIHAAHLCLLLLITQQQLVTSCLVVAGICWCQLSSSSL